MKKAKWLAVSALVLCLGLTGTTLTAQAAEVEPFIGEAASMEDSIAVNEDSIVSATTGNSIRGYNFNYTDVRTPSNTRVFNGGDGKYHVIVYGGVGSCGNTNSAINSLSKLTAYMDLNQIEINVFDIKNDTSSTMIDSLNANNISTDIKVCKNKGDVDLYNTCAQAAYATGTFTMPIIAYVNTTGTIVKATTGYATAEDIRRNIESMGCKIDVDSSYQVLNVSGTVDYTAAFKVLELLNKDRAAGGLSALTMDPGLLESAMQRAAECSLYYGHTRPNGENCYSLDSKMYRENIAVGYTSAEQVETGWMQSSGHKANIMATENKSVGIGVFVANGTYYWVQCFGNDTSVSATQPSNTSRSYNIQTVQNLVDPYFKQDTFNIDKRGDAVQFEVWVNNEGYDRVKVRVDGSSYNWSSDNSNFEINIDGKVTAKKWGETNITAVNKNNSNYNLMGSVKLATNITVSNGGIYLAEVSRTQVTAGMTYKTTGKTDMEYSWYVSTNGTNWSCLQDWKENDEWLRWTPSIYGEYTLRCLARVEGNPNSVVDTTVPVSFHPQIKGKCQMPYSGAGGGYLIGVETYENPNQSYTYEMLILDCTLLAQGKDAWIYSTGRCGVAQGNALWTVWQPQYGYYWTLFRIYDADGNMIDEACYGFQNI